MTAPDDDRQLDVWYVRPDRFHCKPQVGVPCVMSWTSLAAYLSRPTIGDSKEIAGGWSPALYTENVRRKSNLVHACALVVDIDAAGDVARVAEELSHHRCIVHETYSSTDAESRCRLVVDLAEPVDAATYERAHAILRRQLRDGGFGVDEGAKDASRLSYSPVRRPGAGYRFVQTDGAPLDARTLVAAHPEPKRHAPSPRPITHPDHYVCGAIARARSKVLASVEPGRHDAVRDEAYSLARLGLDVSTIEAALLEAFVHVAGEHRRREGERTIADAVAARLRGAA